VKKFTTTTTAKNLIESLREQPDEDFDEAIVSKKRAKKMQPARSGEAKDDVKALSRRVRDMNLQGVEEEAPAHEMARFSRTNLLENSPDHEMEDVATRVKTEQGNIDDAWAAFDAAVAEDPSLVPKPQPRILDNSRMPQTRKRERDITDDLAELTTSSARFVIKLDVCFDPSNLSTRRRERNMHYEMNARDATTIKNFFGTLWLENQEWLIHEGYSLERVRQVKRLEITRLIKEEKSIENTHCWSIRGDFDGQEQCGAWMQFLDAAETWGRRGALNRLRIIEKEERMKRKRCVQDHLGNFYTSNGDYWKPKRHLVHAQVDVNIVLCFD
jgi:hypothetical protein